MSVYNKQTVSTCGRQCLQTAWVFPTQPERASYLADVESLCPPSLQHTAQGGGWMDVLR